MADEFYEILVIDNDIFYFKQNRPCCPIFLIRNFGHTVFIDIFLTDLCHIWWNTVKGIDRALTDNRFSDKEAILADATVKIYMNTMA